MTARLVAALERFQNLHRGGRFPGDRQVAAVQPQREQRDAEAELLMTLGFGVALFALWLDGRDLPVPWKSPAAMEILKPFEGSDQAGRHALEVSYVGLLFKHENTSMPILACYL